MYSTNVRSPPQTSYIHNMCFEGGILLCCSICMFGLRLQPLHVKLLASALQNTEREYNDKTEEMTDVERKVVSMYPPGSSTKESHNTNIKSYS